MKKLITFISRAAMTLLTLVMAFTTQTARANCGWYDTSITIGGLTANFSEWSRGNGAQDTDLGVLFDLTISSVELKIWDDANDRGGANMYFRLYGDNGQIGDDVDVWLGAATRIAGDHDFSISYTGSFNLASAFGVTLEPGKTYYLNMWAKSYGDAGDHWYNGDGDNYHTKFKFIADNWNSSTKTLTVNSNPADGAYKNHSVIENLIISEGVTSIGEASFQGCTGLETVTISNSVTSIGEAAFDGCTSLSTVTLSGNPSIGSTSAFPSGATVEMNLTANQVGGAKWMTFYNNQYNFQADENTQVFKVELSGEKLKMYEVEDKIVNANTGVVLKSTDNPVMTRTTSASSNTDGNSLVGVSNPDGEETDGTFYVLNARDEGVGFYKLAEGRTVGVGKAYLTSAASSAREFFLFGEATGIGATLNEAEMTNNHCYDLQGRRVAQPTKGLYIVNGKKIIK